MKTRALAPIFLSVSFAALACSSELSAQARPRPEMVAVVPEVSALWPDLAPRSFRLQLEAALPTDVLSIWASGNRLNYDDPCTLGPCVSEGWTAAAGVHLNFRGYEKGFSPYVGVGLGYTRWDTGDIERPSLALVGISWRNARYVTPRLELRIERGKVTHTGDLVVGFGIGFPRPPMPDTAHGSSPGH